MNELDIIKTIQKTLSDSSMIGDDTAFIEELGIILTQDTLVEDVHFRLSTISAYNLGIKSVAVNLSDIAASGGIAKYLLISLSLPKNLDDSFIREFYRGVDFMCKKYGVSVAGGDITGSDKVFISICAIGANQQTTPSKRSNAKIGDIIVTTGEHGSSYAGFVALEKKMSAPQKFINSHINPIPQLDAGRKILLNTNQPAMMDTSDGLADAVFKIAEQSKVSAVVDFEKIPYDRQIEQIADSVGENFVEWVLFGAEDYQLVACISKEEFKKLKGIGIELFEIGEIQPQKEHAAYIKIKEKTLIIDENTIKANCFNHFKEGRP
jgi:thiamine-monophosphate kinase